MGPETVKELIDVVKGSMVHKWSITTQERRAIILALESYLDLLARINGDWEKVNKSKAG